MDAPRVIPINHMKCYRHRTERETRGRPRHSLGEKHLQVIAPHWCLSLEAQTKRNFLLGFFLSRRRRRGLEGGRALEGVLERGGEGKG